MSEFKKCKVELGDKRGCFFNDLLYLPLSPSLLQNLVNIFEKRAMDAKNYSNQGLDRESKDYFEDAFNQWKSMREALDKHNEEKKNGIT